jgi:hypothetical protein
VQYAALLEQDLQQAAVDGGLHCSAERVQKAGQHILEAFSAALNAKSIKTQQSAHHHSAAFFQALAPPTSWEGSSARN